MAQRDRVVGIIFSAIDEVNLLLPQDQQLEKMLDTVIVGGDSRLDSLGFISLIVAIEQKIEQEFMPIILTDEAAMSQYNNPFRCVTTLVDYILQQLNRESNG